MAEIEIIRWIEQDEERRSDTRVEKIKRKEEERDEG